MKLRLILAALILLGARLYAQEKRMEKVVELRGEWKFEIGDNPVWAKTDFDASNWDNIFVPSNWEDEGFPGYDGYAWYRKEFQFNKADQEENYYLLLGTIDDADEAYINGHLIGVMGGFPPDYVTQFNAWREYRIPAEYLNFNGRNVVAVRVYDEVGEGGITNGRIGIYVNRSKTQPEIDLNGLWKFKTGDDLTWKDKTLNDEDWDEVIVPLNWEKQGYSEYDGMAWYRRSFYLPKSLEGNRLILLLGKIDDYDEAYLNGEELGHTGRIPEGFKGRMVEKDSRRSPVVYPKPDELGDYYLKFRAYYIPAEQLNFGGENQIAVRVFDGFKEGGFFEGPIGVITRDRYVKWKDRERSTDNILELIFGN